MSRTVITPALLRAVGANKANAQLYAPLLDAAVLVPGDAWNSITSRRGVCSLVAHLGHESGGFSVTAENMNYTAVALRTGNRKKYFTQEQADKYGAVKDPRGNYIRRCSEDDQRMIANLYYGGRMGNRGVDTDDGWNLRGGGLTQTTGRDNWTAFAESCGLTVEQAAAWGRQPDGAVASALFYWRNRKGLILACAQGDLTESTRLVQGADGGLVDRIARYNAAMDAAA